MPRKKKLIEGRNRHNPEDISEDKISEAIETFYGVHEARNTRRATEFGWSVAQTAGVFFSPQIRESEASAYHVS